jgi:hypothetical protein
LLFPESSAFSKSGALANVNTPVFVSITKNDESVPEIDQVRVAPASTSVPVYVITEVEFSDIEIACVVPDALIVMVGASFVLVTDMVNV